MILIIDNYDSFTYNLVQYFGELGLQHSTNGSLNGKQAICESAKNIKVFRNDKISIEKIKELNPSHIVISPGPGTPDDAGISKEVIKEFAGKKPILGVCLGHQAIGEVFGGKIINAPYLMHGKTTNIIFDLDEPLFKEMQCPFTATRYHSLIIDKKSLEGTPLDVIAWTSDNLIMAVRHKEFKNLVGVQFHPESILTEFGHQLLQNFLEL